MQYLKRAIGITKIDKTQNTQVREDLEVQSVTDFIEQRQLSWWAHLNRMESIRLVKQVWKTTKIHKKTEKKRTMENLEYMKQFTEIYALT